MISLPDLSDLSTYPIAELLRGWKLGELSAEQAVVHLIQHVVILTHHRPSHYPNWDNLG